MEKQPFSRSNLGNSNALDLLFAYERTDIDRIVGKVQKMKLGELISQIEKTTLNKPFKVLPLPKYLSKRP